MSSSLRIEKRKSKKVSNLTVSRSLCGSNDQLDDWLEAVDGGSLDVNSTALLDEDRRHHGYDSEVVLVRHVSQGRLQSVWAASLTERDVFQLRSRPLHRLPEPADVDVTDQDPAIRHSV